MSCASKSAQKRKLQTSECEKPAKKKMAWDSFTSIKDFGYEFNEEGRLVDIENGDGFNFYVSDEHWYNQQNYEKLGEVITEDVYELLQSEDVGLKKLEIPLDKEESSSLLGCAKQKNKDSAKGFIFVSEDYDKKEKLLVLVHGSGVVRAGQWARRLIINDCLDHGTQIPYIKKAIQEGYGVVVTNTNQNEAVLVNAKGKKTYKTIKESESPEKHFSYVWKNIIEKTQASKIFAVAHSYGGYLVVNYFSRFPDILKRVVAVAFTDSVHSLNFDSKANVRKWFLSNSVNWVTSYEDLDTPMSHQEDKKHITRVSAGTTKHEETSWKAMESVFKYFHNKEVDSNKPSDETKKNDGKSGGKPSKKGKKEIELAANFQNTDKISKKLNCEESKKSDVVITSESLKFEGSSEQSKCGVEVTSNERAKKCKKEEEEGKSSNQEPGDSSDASNLEVTSDEKAKKIKEEEKSNQKPENSSDASNPEVTSEERAQKSKEEGKLTNQEPGGSSDAYNLEVTSKEKAKKIKEEEKSTNQKPGGSCDASNLEVRSEEKANKIEEASKLKSGENSKQDGMNDHMESKQEPANNTEDTSERRAKEIKEQEKSNFNTSVVSSEQDRMNADVAENVESTGEKIVKVKVLVKDAKDIHHSRTDDQKDDQPTNPDKVQQITNEKGMQSTRKEKPNSEANNVEELSNKENDALPDSHSSKPEESVKTDVSHTCKQPTIGSSKDDIEKKSNGEEGTANKKDDTSPPHEAGSKSDLATHDADRESENHSTDNDDIQVSVV
ncbi:Hypothetical predicted protein [Paramuricea clavata]|uniref:Arb2 domain-containing protein n=1 Tax=Paramuricea clavata TaxID=317549 RepID=A0A7D9DGP8_PARCT|nr:Hypothetical predicted protein [Paramuricea clavata]